MQVQKNSETFKTPPHPMVAIGNFDGIHLGHQSIIKKMVVQAKKIGASAGIYTFDPHPAKILAHKSAPLLIQTNEQKLSCLRELQIDWVILEKFTKAYAQKTPEEFFYGILLEKLKVKSIWVGYDFTFGKKRAGGTQTLQQLCQKENVDLNIIKPHFEKDILVSSSRIRDCLMQGEVSLAKDLLGRSPALIGKVVSGAGIGGSKLGIQTANLEPENELIPKAGVYITKTSILDSQETHSSVTNIGNNPTFPDKAFSIETHLLDYSGDLKNKRIEVYFEKRIRDEKSFPSKEELILQIKKDIKAARAFSKIA